MVVFKCVKINIYLGKIVGKFWVKSEFWSKNKEKEKKILENIQWFMFLET